MSAEPRDGRGGLVAVEAPARRIEDPARRARALATVRRLLLAIPATAVSFDVRGFHESDAHARATLERHGGAFVSGFNAALPSSGVDDLELRLTGVDRADRGFAYEGAAMACAVLDLMTPLGGKRLERLLQGPGRPHVYMLHVGAGWALARLHLRPRSHLPALDRFLRWLVVDGYGFHHGFFDPGRFVDRQAVANRLSAYERRTFDHGLGRCLWFVDGADVERVAHTIDTFAAPRRADLWSGVGLAATYTTAVDEHALRMLSQLSVCHRRDLVQGSAFAVVARSEAGNLVDHTHLAAGVLCGESAERIVEIVQDARRGLRADDGGRNYERWRGRIRDALCAGVAVDR